MTSPDTASPVLPRQGCVPAGWAIDVGLAVFVFVGLVLLRPVFPDGDGGAFAARALSRGGFWVAEVKHVFYEDVLTAVALLLDGLGLRQYALEGFTLVSNLAGAVLYLLLARAVYPTLLGDRGISRICALGAIVSFGVLNACATIETYALALTLAVALVALCLHGGLASPGKAVGVGILYVLAVGVHITNVLIFPLLVAFAVRSIRRHGWRPVAACGLTIALGAVVVAAGPLLASGGNLTVLLPKGDSQPAQSLFLRVGRAGYGILRTAAWLAPIWELTRTFALLYGGAILLALAWIAAMAWRGFRSTAPRYREAGIFLLLLVVPYAALGLAYFPSDPERWLFLVPAAWLVVGRAWVDASAGPALRALLLGLVVVLGVYNAGFKLWPETRENRDVAGKKALAEMAGERDLVVSPTGMGLDEFAIRRSQGFEVLALDVLMWEHGPDRAGCLADLRRRLREARPKGRTFVFALLGEDLAPGRGYPWALVAHWGYTPHEFQAVLEEFLPEPVVEPTRAQCGTYRLTGGK